jgi:hypothetical protein
LCSAHLWAFCLGVISTVPGGLLRAVVGPLQIIADPGGGYPLGPSSLSGGSEAGFTREVPPSHIGFVLGSDKPLDPHVARALGLDAGAVAMPGTVSTPYPANSMRARSTNLAGHGALTSRESFQRIGEISSNGAQKCDAALRGTGFCGIR